MHHPHYPKQVEQIESKIKSLEETIESTRKKIEKADAVLKKHKASQRNKGDDYEEYNSLIGDDPKAAEELSVKKKLKITNERTEKKEQETVAIRALLNRLLEEREALLGEKVVFSNYDPLQEHLKNPAIQEAMKEFKFSKERLKSNSKFATLQALFSRPNHRIVPKPEGKFGTALPDQLPLEAVVMDPDLIPDWVLEEFGFAQIPAGATHGTKLKAKIEAMPKIRTLFKNARPLETQADDKDRKWLNHRMLAVQGMGEDHDGKILYTRYEGRSVEGEDRKLLQVFHSAYDSHRKTNHVDRRYGEETPKIVQAEFRIQAIHQELLEIRKDDPDAAAKKKGIRTRLIEEMKLLSHATNVHKRSAFSSILDSVDLKDSMGRDNLGAACARLLKALGQIRRRRPQIYKRSQFGHADQQTLDETIAKGEICFSEYRNAARAMCQKISNSPKKEVGVQAEPDAQSLLGPLRSLISQNKLPPVSPFNFYGKKLQSKLDEIEASFLIEKAEKRDPFARISPEMSKAYHLTQIFDFQKRIERLIMDVSLSPSLNLDPLIEKALSLEIVVSSPEIPVPAASASYQAAYATVLKFAQDLVRGLRHHAGKKRGPEDTLKLRHKLKAYLETLDFPGFWPHWTNKFRLFRDEPKGEIDKDPGHQSHGQADQGVGDGGFRL